MSSIQSRDHRLAGIFHAAGVLDDNPIDSLQKSQIENVMMPKAVGAWNLHLATANIPLDHFIMFSSISSLVGTPGQGSYVAANAFLDALAIYRSAQGLAGTAINWGVIGAVGMAARKKELLGYLTELASIKCIRKKRFQA
ncbi:KR domain-containing protein [Ochrobactrum grignonense]|nr:KR domain-containing protein [Brucella grignonensis]